MTIPDFRIPRVFGAMLQEEQGKGECAAGAVPPRAQGRDTGCKHTGSRTPGARFPFALIKSNGGAGSALKDKAARCRTAHYFLSTSGGRARNENA